MRLSDILKNTDLNVEHKCASPAMPVEKKRAPVPPPKSEVAPPSAPPQFDSGEIERKIRARIENEYRAKLAAFQEESKRVFTELMKEQESRALEREKAVQEQRQELNQLKEDLKLQQDQILNTVKTSYDSEITQRLEEEKRKADFEKQKLQEMSERAIQELGKKLEEQRRKLEEKERQLALDKEKPAPKVEMPSAKTPEIEPAPDTTMPKQTSGYFPDKNTEERAKQIYAALAETGSRLFQQLVKSETPDIGFLASQLGELMELVTESDAELVGLTLGAYPDGSHFIYHAINVTILTLVLALEFQFTQEQLKELALAAFLHDIGLVNMVDDLSYPSELSGNVKKEILNHPVRGAEMMQPWLSEASLLAIRQHHEVGNGKGYPNKLQAAGIHIYAGIIHVVDCFEALTHERPYRPSALDVSQAVKEIIESGRGVYDRMVLKALMSRIGLYPVMSYVELSNKQVARVIRQNRQLPVSPTVLVEFDEEGRKLFKPAVIDLSQTQFVHILGAVKKDFFAPPARSEFSVSKRKPNVKKFEIPKEIISFFLIAVVSALLLYIIFKI